MAHLSMVPLLINSSRIKYSVLDDIFDGYKIPDQTVNLYIDGYYLFYKLYRSEYEVDIYETSISQFIKDTVIAVLNTIAHYRRYIVTRMRKFNRIFVVFNRRSPVYQTELIPQYGKTYYEKLYPTHFRYGSINMIVEQAIEMLQDLCNYIEDIYVIDSRKIEDHITIAYLQTLYNGFNIYFTRNELVSLLLEEDRSLLLYPKRDDSYVINSIGYFQKFFSGIKYKPTYLTSKYAKFYFCLSGIKSKSIPPTCVKGTIKGAKILDSMIEDNSIDIHTSITNFVSKLPKYLGRELTKKEESDLTLLYRAIDIRTASAAMTNAQKARIHSSLVNLYDQAGLEELNELVSSEDDVINLTSLNMNKVREPVSFWNWDE